MSLGLGAYRVATRLLEPLAPMILRRRAGQGKEDAARMDERLGHASAARPPGPLIWLHGASVGETLSALPLAERIRRERPHAAVLITSGTVASARILADRLPLGVIHQYAPIDAPEAAARFLDHWRPDLLVLLESELWPNLILGASERGCRLALISARITEGTQKGWERAPGAARAVLSALDRVLPQDDLSAERLQALGARVDGRVNLKLAGEALGCDRGEFERLSAAIGDRPCVVSASTHPGEEAIADAAVAGLADRPLHIIVPRHPVRADAIEAGLALSGRAVARRSRGEALAPDLDVYLADTLGELGLFFRLADVVVLGGGWAEGVGGHNPLEPARLGKAIVSGPAVANWESVFAEMAAAQAVLLTPPEELRVVLAGLLADPDGASTLGERGRAYARAQEGQVDTAWDHLKPLMPA